MNLTSSSSSGSTTGRMLARLSGPALFAWLTWAALTVAALGFVLAYAPLAPISEDWTQLVPIFSGQNEITPAYLWAQNNEHRFPLVKILLAPLAIATSGQFWIENALNTVLVSALGAFLLLTARRLRGRTSYADAFIPILLLHFGNADVYTLRILLGFVLNLILGTFLLVTLITRRSIGSFRELALVATVLVLLPLCGANGLPLTLAGAVWLWLNAGVIVRSNHPERRRLAGACVVAGILPVVLVGLYFIGFQRPMHLPPPESLKAFLSATGCCLARCLVPYDAKLLPGVVWIVPALVVLTVGLLLVVFLCQPGERVRSLGIVLYGGAILVVALGIGWGRASLGPEGASVSRYALAMAPLLLAVYFAWVLYSPAGIGEFVPMVLLALVCMAFPLQTSKGIVIGGVHRQNGKAFIADMLGGAPPEYLVHRYGNRLFPRELGQSIQHSLVQLHQLGLPPYSRMGKPLSFSEMVPLAVAEVHEMEREGSAAVATGADPFLVFSLPERRHVNVIEVRFVMDKPNSQAGILEAFWCCDGDTRFDPERRNRRLVVPTGPQEQCELIWINDTIDRFRLDPDTYPVHFEVRSLRILE